MWEESTYGWSDVMCDVSIVDGIAEVNDGRDDDDATSDIGNSFRGRKSKILDC